MDWLTRQIEEPEKRERLFKILTIISQGMLFFGMAIIIYIFKDKI